MLPVLIQAQAIFVLLTLVGALTLQPEVRTLYKFPVLYDKNSYQITNPTYIAPYEDKDKILKIFPKTFEFLVSSNFIIAFTTSSI